MTDAAALLAQALAHERAGRGDAARALYEQVEREDPGHPGALLKLALYALARGRPDVARDTLERARVGATARGLNAVPLWLASAEVARATGEFAEAAGALAEAVALDASNLGLRLAHADALRVAGDVNGAVAALSAATSAMPRSVEAWLALGGLLMSIELATPDARRATGSSALARAIAAFDQAIALAPDAPAVLAAAAMAHRYACDWVRCDQLLARLFDVARDLARPIVVSPVIAAALIDDPALQRRAIADFTQRTLPPASTTVTPPAYVRSPGSRLRVGYLSSDLHDHATAHLAAGLFERHDRSRIEAFAYALDGDDGSAMRQRLHRAFEHWRDVRMLSDREAATRIASDRLDVLVDLKGHTQGSRFGIVAARPAPVQIHYLGFPGTLAHDAIDALVADATVVPPGAEAGYAETILRMPGCYQVNDRERPLPEPPPRESVGLPPASIVLVSFNQTYKLGRDFVDAWLDALAAHPRTVLWLTVPQPLAREQLLAAARDKRVAEERIVFAPYARHVEHLARLRCADLALDVLPYGSHTTGSDALWCGVPLLTITGRTFAGRVGTSLVYAVGLRELATASLDDYRARLDELLRAPARLAAYREHLERGRETFALFDTERFTRGFERLLEDAATSLRRP